MRIPTIIKTFPTVLFYPAVMIIFFSCAVTPRVVQPPPEEFPPETIPQTAGYGIIPDRPERRPEVPEYIMGTGFVPSGDMAAFLLNANPSAETNFITDLVLIYTEEAAIEGVNHDVAFAQMCLETGFLRYGGLVTPDMNNFCGLGAIGPGQPGERFPDPRTGVRAHIQHLKAYATDEPLNQALVDPRYKWVRLGSSPAIRGLAGTWASDREYATKINSLLERLYTFSFDS